MAKQDLVSVIIPCYNYGHFVGEALDSVNGQTYPHVEIVVVDDGSTDNTQEVVAAYPNVHYIRQNNRGLSSARNTGLSKALGTYVLFLDADDRLLPNAIEIGVRSLATRKECAFAFGHHVLIGTRQGLCGLPRDQQYDYQELLKRNFIANPGAALFNQWAFSQVGGFDETLGAAEDYDMFLRIARLFPIVCHHKPVVEYRKHEDNMSRNARVMLQACLAALDRQRDYVRDNPELLAAYSFGRRHWQEYYGEPLIMNMHEHLRVGQLMEAAHDCLVLAHLYPRRLPIYFSRKLSRFWSAVSAHFAGRH